MIQEIEFMLPLVLMDSCWSPDRVLNTGLFSNYHLPLKLYVYTTTQSVLCVMKLKEIL